MELETKRERQRRRERDGLKRFDGIDDDKRRTSTASSAFRLPRLWNQQQFPSGSHALSRGRCRRVRGRDAHGHSGSALLEGRTRKRRREGPRRRRWRWRRCRRRRNPGRAAACVFVPFVLGCSRIRRADAARDPWGSSTDAGVPFPGSCGSSSSRSGSGDGRGGALCKLPFVFFGDGDDDAGVEESAERSGSFRSRCCGLGCRRRCCCCCCISSPCEQPGPPEEGGDRCGFFLFLEGLSSKSCSGDRGTAAAATGG